ncbi:MAG: chemotaxis protein CheY [Myxococcales bacterium]|nr:chemotaxis protein CheY [Myxococcales bacterium]
MVVDSTVQAFGLECRVTVGPLQVLIVERDLHVRELETHFFEQAGYTVNTAIDGQVALELAISLQPDVIVTEVLLGKIDGLALCRQLKSNPVTKNIPILVFSVLATNARAKEAGADAFLMKPLAKERLLGVIDTLVQSRDPANAQERR